MKAKREIKTDEMKIFWEKSELFLYDDTKKPGLIHD